MKIDSINLIAIIFVSLWMIGFLGFAFYNLFIFDIKETEEYKCLNEIAIKYCESLKGYLKNLSFPMNNFDCIVNREAKTFWFKEEEKKYCKNG